jgi:hypothetical protein
MKINTFLLEEHNEAYIAWHYALEHNLISLNNNNVLLHVDEHSDLASNQFKTSVYDTNFLLDKVKNFTYNEVGIAGFIVPAILLGMFNEVYWVKQTHNKNSAGFYEMFARSYNSCGKKLKCNKISNAEGIDVVNSNSDLKRFNYYLCGIEAITPLQQVILDIDLDYFSCSGEPSKLNEVYIEITKTEFQEFNEDKYHALKHLLLGHQIETLASRDSYFYVINNYQEIYAYKENVSFDTILERITTFVSILKEKNIQPLIIDICRSKISGYTPKDQCDFIQKNLISQLQTIYDLNILSIDDI